MGGNVFDHPLITEGVRRAEVTPDQRAYLSSFGRGLWRRRVKMGLSRRELAELAGTHRNTIMRLENGQSIALSTAVSIMHALNKGTEPAEDTTDGAINSPVIDAELHP